MDDEILKCYENLAAEIYKYAAEDFINFFFADGNSDNNRERQAAHYKYTAEQYIRNEESPLVNFDGNDMIKYLTEKALAQRTRRCRRYD